jgi:hypothetical protein
VWLVRESATGREFAAKVIVGDNAMDRPAQDLLERARKEVRIAQARPHEHILRVHAALPAEVSGQPAVATLADYAPGGSLAALVQVRGGLPVGECVTAVAPIAQALAALHADGTAHGDVSPGNILFTVEGKPLLADFGLGRMIGDEGVERGGTPGFTAPWSTSASTHDVGRPAEAGALRPAVLAAADDVFSLGAVAWFALTGAPPAPTDARAPLPLLLDDVPMELTAAVEAALRDDPRQRPSAEELARSILRSARPAHVDLAAAVDDTVLPQLITRRREPERSRRQLLSLGRRRGLPRRRGAGRRRAASAQPSAQPIGAWADRRGTPSDRRGRAHGRRRWLLWSGAAATAVGAVLALVWWAGFGAAPTPGRDGAIAAQQVGMDAAVRPASWAALPDRLRHSAESADPVQAVQALSEIRARAIAARDRELLAAVNAPGSAAHAADTALLDRLAADGQQLEGFSARVLTASLDAPLAGGGSRQDPGAPRAAGAEIAVVRARVVTSGYTVKDSGGTTVGERPSGADQELRVVVQRAGGSWRVAAIAPA